MNKLADVLKLKLANNKMQLKFSIVITFIVGLICHAYMFFQDSFSHDGINEFNASIYGNEWKIQLGRFVVPFYRMITRGNVSVPWLIGLISLFWIALSVFVVIKAFEIKNKALIILTAGLFSTNIAIISTVATYIHDLDSNMFALLLAVLAFYLMMKYNYGFLLAVPFVTLSMGLYQSYISVTIVLVLVYLIKSLLDGTKFKEVFIRGIKSVVSLVVGAGLYFVSYKSVLMFNGIQEAKDGYNTLDQISFGGFSELMNTIVYVYKATVYNIFFPKNAVSKYVMFALIALSAVYVIAFVILKAVDKKIRLPELLLIAVLVMFLPVGMSVSGVLMGDFGHDLMRFSDCLVIFMLMLFIFDSRYLIKDNQKIKTFFGQSGKFFVSVAAIFILLSNVLSANQIYLKKDLEQDASLSFFTRVVDKMDTYEGYDRKTTPVVFIGRPDYFDEHKAGFSNGYEIMGATGDYSLGAAGPSWYERYFEYKLNYDIITVENSELEYYRDSEHVKEMPSFPDVGCMQIVDGVLVVKLGEVNIAETDN